ncbi:MAG: hypothetical protein ABIG63_06790 [Chloroflexota bacterium]
MIPENEMGVIVLFAQQAEQAGFEIVEIGATFPDAVVRKDGIEYRAELEFLASNFSAHNHDCRGCDLIICWKNDTDDYVLPIMALSEDGWEETDLTPPPEEQKEIHYWRHRAQRAERQNAKYASQIGAMGYTDSDNGECQCTYEDYLVMVEQGRELTVAQIMEQLRASRTTAYRWIRKVKL